MTSYTLFWLAVLVACLIAEAATVTLASIVGSHYRLAPIGTVGIVICPRATVPMSTEQNAGFSLRVVMGNDIGILQDGTIIAFEVSLLGFYLTTKLLELAHNPFATLVVRFAVHDARAEIALCGTISQRRIGIKGRTYRIQLLCFLYFLDFRRTGVGILIADSSSYHSGSNYQA